MADQDPDQPPVRRDLAEDEADLPSDAELEALRPPLPPLGTDPMPPVPQVAPGPEDPRPPLAEAGSPPRPSMAEAEDAARDAEASE